MWGAWFVFPVSSAKDLFSFGSILKQNSILRDTQPNWPFSIKVFFFQRKNLFSSCLNSEWYFLNYTWSFRNLESSRNIIQRTFKAHNQSRDFNTFIAVTCCNLARGDSPPIKKGKAIASRCKKIFIYIRFSYKII